MSDRRKAQLLDVCRAFIEEHKTWQDDPRYPNPPIEYYLALDGMLSSWNEGSIPEGMRQMFQAVIDMEEALAKFRDRVRATELEELTEHNPGDNFWIAVERIEKLLEAPPERAVLLPLEPIADLLALKPPTPEPQICQMYGFIDEHNRPEIWKLREEIKKPGTHTDPAKGWKDPRVAERERLAQEQEDRATAGTRLRSNRARRAAPKEEEPCRETPEQLWREGVDVRQAAKMLLQPEKVVADLYAGFQADSDKPPAAPLNLGPEAEVLELYREETAPKEIAKQTGLKLAEVQAIIKRAEDAQAAAP